MAELSEAAKLALIKEDPKAVLDQVCKEARWWREQDLYTIPIPRCQKAPNDRQDWQHERIELDQIDEQFNTSCNIGGLWGEPSSGLVDIDLDKQPAVDAAPFFFDKTLTYGHKTGLSRT